MPVKSEHFKVLDGKMAYELEGKTHTLDAGQELTVKPGLAHTVFNAAPEQDLRIVVTVSPAVRAGIRLPAKPCLRTPHHSYGAADDGRVG